MSKIYLVRHGDTALNQTHRIRGQKDVSLTPQGYRKARQVAREIAAEADKPTTVFSCDLKRATETAAEITKATGAKHVVIKDLRPWDLGDLQGESESKARSQVMTFINHPDRLVPGGEPYKMFLTRFYRGLKQVMDTASKNGATVAMIVHGSTARATLALFHESTAFAKQDPTEPGDVMELESAGGLWRLSKS